MSAQEVGGVAILSEPAVGVVQGYMLEATPMSLTRWRARPWYKKLLENIFYLFSPLL